jgi:hypothetical protein
MLSTLPKSTLQGTVIINGPCGYLGCKCTSRTVVVLPGSLRIRRGAVLCHGHIISKIGLNRFDGSLWTPEYNYYAVDHTEHLRHCKFKSAWQSEYKQRIQLLHPLVQVTRSRNLGDPVLECHPPVKQKRAGEAFQIPTRGLCVTYSLYGRLV